MYIASDVFEEYVNAIDNRNLDLAKMLLLDNISDDTMIYRYCKGLERDLDNLENRKQWLSNVVRFNDPYDSAVMVDCGFKLQYPREEREKAFEDYLRQQKANIDSEKLRSSTFVACFSETNSSFPMWGYYAAEHKGLCLGYNLKDLIIKYNCFPVIYSEKLLVYSESEEKNLIRLSLTKSKEWKHEQEWRIVRIDENNIGENGVVIEKFPNPMEIYIGCRQKETELDNVENSKSIKKNKCYADLRDILNYAEKEYIDVFLPIISRTEYKLIDRALILNK